VRARPPVTRVETGHLVVRTEIEAADGTELAPIEVRVPVAHADLFDQADLADLDLSPTAITTRLAPALDHLLTGSTEHDLLTGAYA
jgi:hypothetical protein